MIALNSDDEVIIVYRRDDGNDDIHMSVGNRELDLILVASNRHAFDLGLAIDSNDDVHISSHYSAAPGTWYFTNASGSWVRTKMHELGGTYLHDRGFERRHPHRSRRHPRVLHSSSPPCRAPARA